MEEVEVENPTARQKKGGGSHWKKMNPSEVLESFATVTQAFRTATRHTLYGDHMWLEPDMEQILSATGGGVGTLDNHEPLATSLGDFEVLGGELEEEQMDIPRGERKLPLTQEQWRSFFDEGGRVINEHKLRKKIFYGGVDASIRREVWKFLLGYFPFGSTTEERVAIRRNKEIEYGVYKNQWQSITPEQEAHHSIFRERKHAIDKDVVRTDRGTEFFKNLEGSNMKQLNELLVTYTFFNFDLGYVQGMNDLLSLVMMIMGNEVDSFWCFKEIMDKMGDNFERDQQGMRIQLEQLVEILSVLDRRLHAHLAKHDCLNMFFCFRWLLIHFKREFELTDVQVIWEALWSGYMSKYFHLFIAAAILLGERNTILKQNMGFDDLIHHFNALAGQLNRNEILIEAERLYKKYLILSECSKDEELEAKMQQIEAKLRSPKTTEINIFDAVRSG